MHVTTFEFKYLFSHLHEELYDAVVVSFYRAVLYMDTYYLVVLWFPNLHYYLQEHRDRTSNF